MTSLLCIAAPAAAARIIATPVAELTPTGEYRFWAIGLLERKSTNTVRELYRLDMGLHPRAEVGILAIDPHAQPTTLWLNLQGLLMKETRRRPTLSAGLWDATNLDRLGGDAKGGSLFLAVSKTVNLDLPGAGRQPLKLSVGYGANRLNGFFGGLVLPLSRRTGLQVEYSPRNLRLPGAEPVNFGVYHYLGPRWRMRASWMGGDPMVDFFYSARIGR